MSFAVDVAAVDATATGGDNATFAAGELRAIRFVTMTGTGGALKDRGAEIGSFVAFFIFLLSQPQSNYRIIF